MTRGRWIGLLVVGIVGVVIASAIVSNWEPVVPADAATEAVARTVMTGDIAPDAGEGVDPETLPRSPAGHDCMPQIERVGGVLDLCWTAYRETHDADPAQDYYILRVVGTFGGNDGSAVRWVRLRADLVGEPSSNVIGWWPSSPIDGDCREVPVDLPGLPNGVPLELICGGTDGLTDHATSSHAVTWTCRGCLIPIQGRWRSAIALYGLVAVPAGAIPAWDLFADLGG